MNYKINFDDGYTFNIDLVSNEWSYSAKSTISIERNKKINVFCNYYKDENDDRYREYMFCLNKLIKNSLIDDIFILCSDKLYLNDKKIKKISFNDFPRYKDFFNLIDLISNDDDINIIINSDCYIEENDLELIKNNLKKDQAYLLSRWDILSMNPFVSKHFDDVYKLHKGFRYGCSQDAWIFIGKTKKELFGDFGFGRAGCDNAIAYEFKTAGYRIYNPSLDIKIYHYHLTDKRTYGDYGEREKYRIKKPYLFVSSTTIDETIKYKKVVFFNHFHNGDIHYSREFVKDIMKKYKGKDFTYYYSLKNVVWEPSNDILSDISNLKIEDISNLKKECKKEIDMLVDGETIFINTWVGQCGRRYVNDIGINLKSNYEIYKNVYEVLEIEIEKNMDYYIPEIDYCKFEIKKINNFLKKYDDKRFKVLISNGETYSAQSSNFSFEPIIVKLSDMFPDVIFILTSKTNVQQKNNIIQANDIIGKDKNLNEISYLSKFCNIIIGRSSGPYAFCQIKDNFYDENKTFMNFIKDEKQEWYIGDVCEHIISKNLTEDNILETISNKIKEKKNKKLRIAFTIILNGIHHLKHNDYGNLIPKIFDYWVIVEGAASNKGSTRWCKDILEDYHKNGNSIDGTIDYIKDVLQKNHKNIIFIEADGIWPSKDYMVNRAVDEIKKLTDSCFLWQIDIDEQWTKDQIVKSERELVSRGASTGEFLVYQFLGEGIIASGKHWAGNPFIRLWDWSGEHFKTHEPPVLENNNRNKILLTEKMKHYSFYFEQDVKFKDKWYTDHEGCYDRWVELKKEKNFPQHITYLFPKFSNGRYTPGGKNKELDSWIVKFEDVLNFENDYKKSELPPISKNNESTKIPPNVTSSPPSPPPLPQKNSILNDLTDSVYCINMDRRSDKMFTMKEMFNKMNIEYVRFQGIDIIDDPQLGCSKSHIEVIKDALKKNYRIISILEDDVILCNDFEYRLNYFLNTVPEDWEVLYMGSNLLNAPKTIFINKYVQKITKSFGRFAMIINNKNGIFEKIVNLSDKSPNPIDFYYNELQPTSYVFIPFLAKPNHIGSDIHIDKRNNLLVYNAINRFYRDKFQLLPLPKNIIPIKFEKKQESHPPLRKTDKEIGEEFLKGSLDFQIYHGGKMIFDSSTNGRENLLFYSNYFTLYGKSFSYAGMFIKLK